MNTLIVDDEEDIGLIVSMTLKKIGYSVDYVNRIRLAEEKIGANTYDIFFLDLNLPDGTGFDLVQEIKHRNKDAKIVIISAYDGVAELKKAEEHKIDAFIRKPFVKKDIINAVGNFNDPGHLNGKY